MDRRAECHLLSQRRAGASSMAARKWQAGRSNEAAFGERSGGGLRSSACGVASKTLVAPSTSLCILARSGALRPIVLAGEQRHHHYNRARSDRGQLQPAAAESATAESATAGAALVGAAPALAAP